MNEITKIVDLAGDDHFGITCWSAAPAVHLRAAGARCQATCRPRVPAALPGGTADTTHRLLAPNREIHTQNIKRFNSSPANCTTVQSPTIAAFATPAKNLVVVLWGIYAFLCRVISTLVPGIFINFISFLRIIHYFDFKELIFFKWQ